MSKVEQEVEINAHREEVEAERRQREEEGSKYREEMAKQKAAEKKEVRLTLDANRRPPQRNDGSSRALAEPRLITRRARVAYRSWLRCERRRSMRRRGLRLTGVWRTRRRRR